MTELPERTNSSNDTLQTLWQEEKQEILPMLLEDVHKRARRDQLRSEIDFYGGVIGVVLIVIMSGYIIVVAPDGVFRLGYFLTVIGCFLMISFYKLLRPIDRKAIASASLDCLNFYKRSLVKRIRLMQTAWAWMLLPILPGPLLCLYRMNQLLAVPNPGAQMNIESARIIVHIAAFALLLMSAGLLAYWKWRIRVRSKELKALQAL